jgi:hypothetical protein
MASRALLEMETIFSVMAMGSTSSALSRNGLGMRLRNIQPEHPPLRDRVRIGYELAPTEITMGFF